MSSHQSHRDDTIPQLKNEAMPGPTHQSTETPKYTDPIRAQVGDHERTATSGRTDYIRSKVEASTDNSDDGDDDDAAEEFRDRIDAIRGAAGVEYNPMSESLPKLPAYHPSFAKAERFCIELMEDATLILKNAEYKDTRIMQLLEKASNSQHLENPKPRIIGLMGDSGVGKSSLINCLLDTPDIALSGASGGACTNVITEYHQRQPSQKAPYVAEITFFNPASVRRILETHLGSYYRYVHESVENMDQEAIDEMNARFSTALETFQALFPNQEKFSNEERMTEFLMQAESASDPKMLQKLFEWVQESISKCGAEGGIISRSADACEELGNVIEPFIKSCSHVVDENYCQVPSLWPLVTGVRVYLHSPLLKRGLVIADLPGLSDFNKIRTTITTRYLRRCHFGLLVAPIARVQTDNLVQRRLGEIHRLFGTRRALLCSKIDDMPAKQRPSDLAATPQATEEHERLIAALDHLCREKALLTSLKKQANRKAKQGFTQKIGDLELNKKIYNSLLREGLILMRNQKVSTIMRQKYKTITQDSTPLQVFAVSNSDYIKHKDGYDLSEEIPVSVAATGVPHVRYQLSKLPARSRLDALTHYCYGTVEDLVGSLSNWSQQSTIQRRVELQELVAKPRVTVEAIIVKCVAKLKSVLESCILQKCEDCQGAWVDNSVRLFEKWTEEWHGSTFAAWCRNNGAYKTRTRPYFSWNAEILRPVNKDLTEAWKLFDDSVATVKEDCFTALVQLTNGIGEDLAAEEGIPIEPMAPFLSSLASKKSMLRKCLNRFWAKLDTISRDTKLDITLEDEDSDSFLLQAMLPLYEKCASVTGENKHTQRSTLLKDAMSKGEPFAGFCPGIKKSIEDEIDKRQPEVLKALQHVFDMVLEDFNSTFIVEEIPDPKRDVLRSQIQQFVDHAHAKINGPLATELASAMADLE